MENTTKVAVAVAPGRSLLVRGPAGTFQLKENSIIPHDEPAKLERLGLTQVDLSRLEKKGVLTKVVLERGEIINPPARDLTQSNPTIPAGEQGEKEPFRMGGRTEPTANELIEPAKSAPPGAVAGRWGYDPATLQNMSLVELNQLTNLDVENLQLCS